jgi:hypothetical protein
VTAEQRALVAHLDETAGFCEEYARAVRKRPHKDSADKMIELAPTFEILSRATFFKDSVSVIAAFASIPLELSETDG